LCICAQGVAEAECRRAAEAAEAAYAAAFNEVSHRFLLSIGIDMVCSSCATCDEAQNIQHGIMFTSAEQCMLLAWLHLETSV
jgi:hypothetical protein